jgi:DNA topoisomerase-3
VATRADIIEKLFSSFSLEKTGKDIRITRKGLQLLELVPTELRTPLLTAEWESKLEQIAKGKLQQNRFVEEMRTYATRAVQEIARSTQTYKHENVTRTPCPECGKPMLDVKDKKGKLLVCQDRECGSRKRITQTSNARCPNCRKKLELRGEGEGQTFQCGCGYREKLSVFLARKESSSGVSKREVAQFMQQQQQETNEVGPVNSALADALAKWKSESKSKN